jgi:anti-sigma regulatory factor (Ser/Thr protein kinase)
VDTATDRVLKVLNVPDQNGVEPILARVRRLLHLDHDSSMAIAYCLSELLRNVFEHSGSELGAFVAAGYFPSSGRVTVSVADLGITVPAHIKRQFGDGIDDKVALELALEPRTSGSFDRDRNAGLGLYMTRRIADLTGGKFWLLTGSFCARNDGGPSSLGARAAVGVEPVENDWRGTVVAFTLYPSRLGSFDATQRSVTGALLGAPVARAPGLFRRKEIPPGSMVVRVPPDVGNIAQNKVAAARLRDDSIVPALQNGHMVTLDFHGVALTTQSFMHALLAAPLRLVGAPDLPSRLCFRACSDQVREIIGLVMGYILEPSSGEDEDGVAAGRGID